MTSSNKWKIVKTGEIFDLINGHAFKSNEFLDAGTPVLKIKNVKAGYLSLASLEYVDEEFLNSKPEKVAQKNDLLISMSGNRHDGSMETWVGKVCWFGLDIPYLINQRVGILRLKLSVNANPRFLAYQLSSESFQRHFIAVATSSGGQANLSPAQIKSTELLLPPKHIQDRIVSIAGGLEDKMQLNHQINQTLEQMAQAIFKSWFVDFEPVKAKIAALEAGGSEEDALLAAMQAISGKGEEELTRLQAEQPEQYAELRATAELFPSAMQESALGEIPEGWEVVTLSAAVDLIGGGTPKKSEPSFWNGDICWFSVKDAPSDGNVFVVDTEEKITQEGLNHSSTKLLPIGTTIITARGTVGKLALTGVSTAMNQSCYGVVASDGTGPYLNYLRLSEGVDTLKKNTHGAVFDTITRSTFETVIQPRACLAIRQRFEKTVTPMFEAIRNNLIQSRTLSEARDSLLPKLLSGELSVSVEDYLTEEVDTADV